MSAKTSGVVERLLAERIGLDASSVGENLIARGVHARMTALGLRSKAEYERILIEKGEELQALVEEVVVPESWFFRDDRPFEVLANFARSGWLTDLDRPPLNAASLPCAGGEEPYSIAMTLLEAGLPAHRFRVDAVDVSARGLARAIAGVYSPNAFRGPAPAPRSTYFVEKNGAYTLDAKVRSTVRFHLANLLDPSLFADRPPFDVVFCRNLLIYLDEEARVRAFATLARLVADGGLLFLGHADRLDQPANSPFEPTGDKGSFAYRKGAAGPKKVVVARANVARVLAPSKVPRGATSPHPGLPPQGGRGAEKNGKAGADGGAKIPCPDPPAKGGREAEKKGKLGATGDATSPHPDPPSQAGREEEEKGREATPALDRASELADQGRYDEATTLIDRVIRDGGANARAYFLLGMIAQAAGDRQRAEAHYLKAIYLDAQHDEALLALALLARRRGDVAGEATYRRRADRVRSRKVVP